MRKAFAFPLLALLFTAIVISSVRMPTASAASETAIDTAILKGLAYLNSSQASNGEWGSSLFPVASTAMAVLAFENGGHYSWNASDPYNNTVQNGLNWLFSMGTNVTLDNQTWGNPDTSGTGIGVEWTSDGYPIYESSMALLAIVASSAPTNVTQPGPLGVRTYHAIAQDTVDYLAWAQVDLGSGQGGWTYGPEDNGTSGADNSNSAWPTMALLAAELWGINAPAFVKSQLNIWITTCQDLNGNSTTNSNYGSFGYSAKDSILGGVSEAAVGIAELTYVGAISTNASIIAAEGYINRMWNVNNGVWIVNIGNLYCMYAVMKACREALPPIQFIANYDGTPGVQWYNGTGQYADSLIGNQSSDGSWTNWESWAEADEYSTDLTTALGTLILEPYVVNIATKYTLIVTVESAVTSAPIVGASVSAAGPLILSGVTGSGGKIEFDNVQVGSYFVNASMIGYSPTSQTVLVTSNTSVTLVLPLGTVVGGEIIPTDALQLVAPYLLYALFAVAGSGLLLRYRKRKL